MTNEEIDQWIVHLRTLTEEELWKLSNPDPDKQAIIHLERAARHLKLLD